MIWVAPTDTISPAGKKLAVVTPGWEDKHRAELLALKYEADGLAVNNKPRDAYARYDTLFQIVGDHKISSRFLYVDLNAARESMNRQYQLAAPLIEQEEAAERARIEAARRAEEQRVAREREEKQRQEALAKLRKLSAASETNAKSKSRSSRPSTNSRAVHAQV